VTHLGPRRKRRASPERKFSRLEIVSRIAQLHEIHTPEGVQVLEKVNTGGVDQWISIRGLNRQNPVLLFIHGGPGSPVMPIGWAFQKVWEDFFTVVQWDQRGAGKNWTESNVSTLAPTVTLCQLVEDALQMLEYLRQRMQKERIVVMGWSYGTRIAIEVARRRPECISAYVGVAQTTLGSGSEEYIYREIVERAKRLDDRQALDELREIAPYPNPKVKNDIEHVLTVRKWVRALNGGWYGLKDLSLLFWLQTLSPEYTNADVATLEQSTYWFVEQLANNEGDFLEGGAEGLPEALEVPVILMMGRHDLQTPYTKALEYFERLQAPVKRFITFDRGGHFPMFEQPGRFLQCLIDEVLPLTEGLAQFTDSTDIRSNPLASH
jgi:proline iminopeptidase